MTANLGANTGAGMAAQREPVASAKVSVHTMCKTPGVSHLGWVLAAALFVGACSSGQDIAAAEGQISRFRQLIATQEFGRIYAEAADELRKAGARHG